VNEGENRSMINKRDEREKRKMHEAEEGGIKYERN
jgi:hypothetical protein